MEFDLFASFGADPQTPPALDEKPAKAPEPAISAPTPPRPPAPPRGGADMPCSSVYTGTAATCDVGGGDAPFTDGSGRRFCMTHRPADFLPADRR